MHFVGNSLIEEMVKLKKYQIKKILNLN